MNELISISLLGIAKILFLILMALFIIFSLVVVRQVQLMTKVLHVPISGSFKVVSLGLLIFAIAIFVISLVVL